MRNVSVARKYARALFETSQDQKKTPRIGEQLALVLDLVKKDDEFLKFLYSPEVLTESKHEFLNAVFGPRLDELLANLLRLLVEKGRINVLPEIGEAYRELVEASQGILRVRVETTVPLDAEQEARLQSSLNRMTGKQILLEKKIDPSILGGVVVHLGNTIIDRSLRRGLFRMRESLNQAPVN